MADNRFRITISGAYLNKTVYRDIVKGLKQFGDTIKIPINVDTKNVEKSLQSIRLIANEQGEVTNATQKYNVELGKTLVLKTKIRNAIDAEGKFVKDINGNLVKEEITTSEILVNQKEINKEYIKQAKLVNDSLNKQKQLILETNKNSVKNYYNQQQKDIKDSIISRQQQIQLIKNEVLERKKLAEQMAKGREKSQIDAIKREKDLEIKQVQAMNKAQEDAYKQEIKRKQKLIDLEIFKQNKINSLNKLKIGKENIFNTPEIKKETNSFLAELNKLGSVGGKSTKELSTQFDNLKLKVAQTSNQFKNVNKDGYNFVTMATLAAKKVAIWTLATSAIYAPISALQNMIRIVVEVDKALIEANKVLDLTQQELQQLTVDATNVGIAFGRTTTEVLNAVAAFAKAGLDKETSQNMAKLALLLGNVGNMSVDAAQEMLIAANAGYELNNSYSSLLGIIDKMNEVSNKNATEVANMAEAWKNSASTANMAGLAIDQYNALLGTSLSVSQKSGAEVGNAWRTILMRIQGVSDGLDTLDEDLGKAEEALNSVGIAVRSSEKEFRPVMDVLQELSSKFKDLSDVEKSYVTESLAGKWRANILKGTLQNFDMVNKQMVESMNSSGSAMKENENYMEGIEAKTKQLIATWEQLSQTVLKSDWLKYVLTVGKEFIQLIDRMIKGFGGWNIALIAVNIAAIALTKSLIGINTQLATTGVLSFTNVIKSLMTTFLSGITITGALNAQLMVFNVLTAGIPLIIGAITFGIMAYANNQQKLKEQTEAVNKAQSDFKKTMKEFQDTLDPGKINEAADALNRLKEAINYDEKAEEIKRLEEDIQRIQDVLDREGSENNKGYVVGLEKKKQKLAELKDEVQEVEKTQTELNKATEIATALDYKSAEQKARTLASTIQQAKENLKLAESYKSVYDKLVNGVELTEEETELNNQLLEQYPEYSKLLNDKTKAIGLSYDALKKNLTIQEALAIAEFNEAKVAAQNQINKTNILLDETNKRIDIINAEIEAMNKLNNAKNQALKKASNPIEELIANTIIPGGFDTKGLNEELVAKNKLRQQLESSKAPYEVIAKADPASILKGSSGGYFPKGKDSTSKSSSSSSKEQYKAIADQYLALNNAIQKTNNEIEVNKTLIGNTNDEEKKIELLYKEEQLYIRQQQNVHALADAYRVERESLKKSLSQQGFKFAGEGDNAVITNLDNIKGKSKEVEDAFKRFFDLQISQIPALGKQWQDYAGQINSTKKSIEDIYQEQIDANAKIADELINVMKDAYEKQKDLAVAAIDKELEALNEAHDNKLELLDEEIEKYEEVINAKLKSLEEQEDEEDYNKQLEKIQKERQETVNKINILSLDDSFEAKSQTEELNKQLAEQDEEIAKMKLERDRELRKENLQDQLDTFRDEIDAKKDTENKEYKLTRDRLEKERKETEDYYDELIKNERYWADLRTQIINGQTDNIKAKLGEFLTDFKDKNQETVRELGQSWQELLNIIDEVNEATGKVDSVSEPKKSHEYGMSDDDYNDFINNGKAWEDAQRRNDKAEMDRLRAANDALRKKYGIPDGAYPSYDTGGYTGSWGSSEGRPAILHEKELVLNKLDTANLLKVVDITRDLVNNFTIPKLPSFATAGMSGGNITYQLNMNIENLNGTKKDADMLMSRVVTGIKKLGGRI